MKILNPYLPVLCLILILIAFPGPCPAQPDGPADGNPASAPNRVEDIRIEIVDYQGHKNQLITMAHDLLRLKQGQVFSKALLDESVSILKLSGRFEEIKVETLEHEQGIIVIFRLKPYLLIREINVSGEYPLFTQDILNVMSVYVGDYLLPDLPIEQESLINRYLVTEGFIEPRVQVDPVRNGKDGTVALDINMVKDRYFSLDSLTIKGNRNVSETRIKTRMSIWSNSLFPGSSGRLRESDLKDDIKDLTTFYRGIGFPEVEINTSLEKDPKSGEVDAAVRIQEGPRYKVKFAGNESFYDFTLKKQLVIFREGNLRGSGLRKSTRNIRRLYRENGYQNVKVRTEEKTEGSGEKIIRSITITIDEGAQVLVEGIDFKGNTAFTSEELRGQMQIWEKTLPIFGKRPFVREILDQDIRQLKDLYRRNGYGKTDIRENLVRGEDGKKISIFLDVAEGVRTVISTIGFEGIKSITQEEADGCVRIKPGDPYQESEVKANEDFLAACISEKGYPHVKVKTATRFSQDRTRASLVYTVNEGPFVRMGRTYFNGNFRTKRKVIHRELDMDQGDPFSLSKMVEGQNTIRNMGIFNSVQFKTLGLREKEDEVVVLADLEEKKPYYVQAALGYESNVGLYGNARAGDRNMLGLNKELWVKAEASQTGERYDLGINEQRIFGTRIAGVYNVFLEKQEEFNQDFELTTIGSNLGFVRRFGRPVFTSVNFSYERRKRSLKESSPEDVVIEDEDIFDPRDVFIVTPSITFDTRNSFVRPQRGIFSSFSVDITNGIQESLDDYLRYRVDVRSYISPLDDVTFAWLGRAGFVDPTGTTSRVPDDQLFYLGGTLDVRGFDENMLLYEEKEITLDDGSTGIEKNPLGGRLALASSIEARVLMGYSLELALFYDIGTIRKTYGEPIADDIRSSYGAGLRYITPIGPVGLLYGRKISPQPDESPDRWHFSIGYTF